MANLNQIELPDGNTYNIQDNVSGYATTSSLGEAAYRDVSTVATSGSTDLITSGAVYTAIENLPEPMVFKGTLGVNGTITTLPAAASTNEGFTYKVITAGTYASQDAKVGDVFVSNGSDWVLIPAGDTDTDTWRNIKVNGTEQLGSAISTGAIDFVNGINSTVTFNSANNSIQIDVSGGGGGGDDTKVTQTETTADGNYEVLLSGTPDYETRTEEANKSISFRFNPSNKGVMEGISSTASGQGSHAEGYMSQATGDYSHAEGFASIAAGHRSHAEGSAAYAGGDYSHAECGGSTASGEFAHAEGVLTVASAQGAHSEGLNTTASGLVSHAEGMRTLASTESAHAEGYYSTASGDYSHAEGNMTVASTTSAHAEGSQTVASGMYAHSEGCYSTASGANSHAEGNGTSASAPGAHAEGRSTIVIGSYGHAEGDHTIASAQASHAEGFDTTVSGFAAHAEGRLAKAIGENSHAEGRSTRATHKSQHVFGEYNLEDASTATSDLRGNYVEIVGNGTTAARSNARTLDWDGNENLSNSLTIGTRKDASTIGQYSISVGSDNDVSGSHAVGLGTSVVASGQYSHAEGYKSTASGVYAHVEGGGIHNDPSHGVVIDLTNIASGEGSHAEGAATSASGKYSHAEGRGTGASSDSSHAEGLGTAATGYGSHAEGNYSKAIGNYSHAEGNGTTASGNYSHAEGESTIAETRSHAEGHVTSATGQASHAEGISSIAQGYASHAEGYATYAQGYNSHAEGYYTTATHKSQHVFGEYNMVDASTESATDRGNYIEMVGNGYVDTETDPDNPTTVYRNARTLDWDGQEYLHSNLVVHGAFANAHDRKGLEVEQGGALITGATEISGSLTSTSSNGIKHVANTTSGFVGQTLGYALSTHSKNQITSNVTPGTISFRDKNGHNVGVTMAYMTTAGGVSYRNIAYNTTTTGKTVSNYLYIGVAKDGSPTYTVPNATAKTAFREAIGAAASSSQDYKENIEPITEEEAKKILDIPVYSYDYKENFGGEKGQYGMIAEELVEKIPSAVNIPPHYENFDPELGDDQPLITIDYWKLIPHMVKTMQIQQDEIAKLKKELSALKGRVTKLSKN